MSPAREDWDELVKKCESCDLPTPVLHPSTFVKGTFELRIGTSCFSAEIHEVIISALNFVAGYQEGMEDAKKEKPSPNLAAQSIFKDLMYATLYGAQSGKAGAYNVD